MDMVKEHKYGTTLAEALLVVSLLLLAILAITPPIPPMRSSFQVQKFADGHSIAAQNVFAHAGKPSSDLKQASKDISVSSSANAQNYTEFADQPNINKKNIPASDCLQYVPFENNKANFYGGLYWSAVQGTAFVARPEFPSLSDSAMVMLWKEKEM